MLHILHDELLQCTLVRTCIMMSNDDELFMSCIFYNFILLQKPTCMLSLHVT